MNVRLIAARAVSLMLVCNVVLLSITPKESRASDVKKRVQIHIGTPSIWSMAQAHYLLASMHKKNLDLDTTMPSKDDLNPNKANGTRVQTLKTLLDVEAQYSQKVGVENKSALREQQFALQRREQAQAELAARENELDVLDARINHLKRQWSPLQEEENQRNLERMGKDGVIDTADDVAMTDEDRQRRKDIALLKEKIAERTADRAALVTEKDKLEKTATDPVAGPTLSEVQFSNPTPPITLPGLENIQSLINKALEGSGKPSIAASIALDNYIQMQYEIISKQLTLLRDEVGPDERIVFLELPASIYTVPGRADDYLAQVQWKVTKYFDDKDKDETGKLSTRRISQWDQNDLQDKLTPIDEMRNLMAQKDCPSGEPRCKNSALDLSRIRALDIIPRQSALNINEYQATASRVNFLGVIKLLMGLGIKVNYQRQRELYEEFLQQEIYASGYGKGSNAFGWTYGALPGSKRVAPGVRTTYAVLVVPRDASMLELTAQAVAFDRRHAPDYDLQSKVFREGTDQLVSKETFYVQVPNQFTQNFSIRSAEYTTVKKGEHVTAIIKGDYFSPQAGILVNGVPLKRALSAANTGSSAALEIEDANKKVHGVYEQVSSREIVLNFSMGEGSAYVGTPTITLITPEKSSAVNFFPIWVNYHKEHRRTLDEMSVTEPMFIEDFKVDKLDIIEDKDGYILGRLLGSGLRRRATILINNQQLDFKTPRLRSELIAADDNATLQQSPVLRELSATDLVAYYKAARSNDPETPSENFAIQESTGSYLLRFKKPDASKWTIRYRQRTKQGVEAQEAVYEEEETSPFSVLHYLPNTGANEATVQVRYTNKALTSPPTLAINNMDGAPCDATANRDCAIYAEGNGKYRQTFTVKYESVGGHAFERNKIIITVLQGATTIDTVTVPLPVSPRVTRINNPRLGRPVGYAGEQPLVTLIGFNLQEVAKVFFGENEAKIAGAPGPTSIMVRVPKLDGVPKGESIQVPVTLEKLDGKKVSSVAFYTYVGAPIPVVLYHPRSDRRPPTADAPPEDSQPDATDETETQEKPKPKPHKPGKRMK